MATDLRQLEGSFWQKAEPLYNTLMLGAEEFFYALQDRFYPLIEQLRPVWEDPLWQVVGLIVFTLVFCLVSLWLITKLSRGITKLTKAIIWLVMQPIRGIIAVTKWLWRKITGSKQPAKKKKTFAQKVNMVQVRRAVNTIQYLTTKREWRYQVPWSLLIGESDSGKTQLIESIKLGRRAQLLPKEKRLSTYNSDWHFFGHGAVIESSSEQLDNNLEQLCWYRPERPVDNIILCISAKTLLAISQNKESPAALEELGQQLFHQLWSTQKKTGFILPVYVFVTQCDEIEGFSAFWNAQPKEAQQQMIGWSNPYRLDTGFSIGWVSEAFEQLMHSLQNAQLQVASGGADIANIDQFMLFLHQFSALEKPLAKVMENTFSRSSLQEALPLRGLYFCGSLDHQPKKETAFVEDVFQQKIFAETHLSNVLEKRRFSSNTILRQFQIGVLSTALIFSLLLIFDITRIVNFNHYSQEKLQQLSHITMDCSTQGEDTYKLLRGLSDVGQRIFAVSMPWSWFDTVEVKKQTLVAEHLLEKTFFTSLECRLQQRANTLTVATQLTESRAGASDYQAIQQKFEAYQAQLIAFEEQTSTFVTLAGPLLNDQGLSKKLTSLLDYLYDNPVPSDISLHSDLIMGAVRHSEFTTHWMQNEQPLVSRQLSRRFLDQLTLKLQQALLQHAKNIPIAPLQSFNAQSQKVAVYQTLPSSSVIGDNKVLNQWLDKTRKDWLSSSPSNSPCGQVAETMTVMQQKLMQQGFDATLLARLTRRFSPQNCDQPVRNELAELSVAPFGVLFTFDQQGLLNESAQLQQLTHKLKSITDLAFLKDSYPPIIDSSEAIVQWQTAPLQQLLTLLINYQEFSINRNESTLFESALNDHLQQVTQRLLSEAMIRPAQQMKAPKAINDIIAFHERNVNDAVKSFKDVSQLLLQIQILLQQQGDSSNVLWLNQQVQKFIHQQLTQLESLVNEYHLYRPVPSPQWKKTHFAQAMFNLADDKQAQSYLTTEQQKISYFAFSYAQPLLQYLQNSDSGLSNRLVQRWLSTLQDLGRFERGEPNNDIALLNDLISQKLTTLSDNQCPQSDFFIQTHTGGSWFAKRREQIEQQVNLHCSSADKKAVIARYQQIAQTFNQQVAGRFPFADAQLAGVKDIKPKTLRNFLQDYRKLAKGLLVDLNTQNQKDGSIPESWRMFIQEMDAISEFFALVWQKKAKQWDFTLNVEFDPLKDKTKGRSGSQSKGSNQIIYWALQSGTTKAHFPNGDSVIHWHPGQTMRLDLRWATGSAYLPLALPGTSTESRQFVNTSTPTASFASVGRWGLFEWLEQYSSDAIHLEDEDHMLSFYVPVAIKGARSHIEEPAYVSRANIVLQAFNLDSGPDDSDTDAIVIPRQFPTYAP